MARRESFVSYTADDIAAIRVRGEDQTDWTRVEAKTEDGLVVDTASDPAVAARDDYIEVVEGVQGGRPVTRGTRLTVSAIHGRLRSGDTFDDLTEDYPDIPREALEAAFLYGKTHPQLSRPARRRGAKLA